MATIIEHRTYTFRPGTLDRWLRKYETEGLAIQQKHLGTFMGLWVSEIGPLHQIVMMWAYQGLGDRETRRANMAADPAWTKFIGEVWALEAIVSQEVKMLKPSSICPALPRQ
jgi:NIPSNAP